MNTPIATLQEVFTAIKDIGYIPKIEGNLITVDLNPEPGTARCYTIEKVNECWLVNQKIILFKEGQDEEEEEENELGSFRTALEVACAIDKEEDSE